MEYITAKSKKIKVIKKTFGAALRCWAFGSGWFSLALLWFEGGYAGYARVFPFLSSSLIPFISY